MLARLLKLPLFRNAGIYTIGSLVNASIPFCLIPILTAHLSPESYGMIAMYTMFQGLMTPIVGMSSHSTISVRYFNQDRFEFAKYLGNCFIILGVSALFCLALFYLFEPYLSTYTLLKGKWLYSIIGVTFCLFLTQCILYIWQISQKPLNYIVFLVSMSLLNLSLSILFVVKLGANWEGRVGGQMLTLFLFALISIIILWRKKLIKIQYDPKYIKDIAKLSFPLIPHSLAAILFSITDRLVLTNVSGLEKTGVYTVAYQLGSLMLILTSSFNSAFVPWLFSNLKKEDHAIKIKIVKLTYAYFAVIWIIALIAILLLKYIIPFIVGPEFTKSSDYIVWIISGFALNGMYLMITNYIFYAEKTYLLSIATVSVTLFNIGLCYYLVKLNGPIGAAQSSTISYFIYFLLSAYFCTKAYPMPWRLKNS